MYRPGCPSGDGSGPSYVWVRDFWGEANGYDDGQAGCDRRRTGLNTWCGTSGILTHYVSALVAPSPPPPSPPLPILPPSQPLPSPPPPTTPPVELASGEGGE